MNSLTEGGVMDGPQPRRYLKEVCMTRLRKLFRVRLLTLGGAKASTQGLGGQIEEDEVSRFNP